MYLNFFPDDCVTTKDLPESVYTQLCDNLSAIDVALTSVDSSIHFLSLSTVVGVHMREQLRFITMIRGIVLFSGRRSRT